MIGTREWISTVQQALIGLQKDSDNINAKFYLKLLKQGKKISQIVSYIWLNEDPETAQKLDGYFKRGDDEELKKLLFAEDPETEEYKILLKIFQKEHLPIFSQDDKEFVKFRVETNTFEGRLSDPGPSDNGILSITIPYPPRPELSDDYDEANNKILPLNGFAAIKQSELKEWLDQEPDQAPYFYENNPYIPASSS